MNIPSCCCAEGFCYGAHRAAGYGLKCRTVPPVAPHGIRFTLPLDSAVRKDIPLMRGCFNYFPSALAGVAKHSKVGNDKHNPGQELHHSRGKSSDHGDCILRHLMDIQDYLAAVERGSTFAPPIILAEVDALCWRALALSQELHEKLAGSPLAPAAK